MEWPRDFQRITWPNGGEVKSPGGSDYLIPFKLNELQIEEEKKDPIELE